MSQPDTLIPDSGNSIDWDRYAYARNNPIRYRDPSGHMIAESDNGPGLSKERSEYYRQRGDALKCQAGNRLYCSYAENHPLETALFTIGGLSVPGLLEYGVLGGGLAAAQDTISMALSKAAEKVLAACFANPVCSRLFNASSVPDLGPKKLGHVFDNPEHNLGPLLEQFGNSREAAFTATYQEFAAIAGQYTPAELNAGVPVVVDGLTVIVRGNLVDGVARIGTFYIP